MISTLLRTRITLIVAAALALPAIAGAQAKPEKPAAKTMGEEHMMSGWKQLDAFHSVMAATWHPAAKSNDLSVIRAKAPELSEAAKQWAASKIPAACDTKSIRDAIAAVVSGAASVAQLVTNQAADADVKAALRDVHTRFEVVEEGCHLEKGHKPPLR